MKTFLLVALMVLCAASLSFAEIMADCEEKCQEKADCVENCTIDKVRNQSSGVVLPRLDDPKPHIYHGTIAEPMQLVK